MLLPALLLGALTISSATASGDGAQRPIAKWGEKFGSLHAGMGSAYRWARQIIPGAKLYSAYINTPENPGAAETMLLVFGDPAGQESIASFLYVSGEPKSRQALHRMPDGSLGEEKEIYAEGRWLSRESAGCDDAKTKCITTTSVASQYDHCRPIDVLFRDKAYPIELSDFRGILKRN